MQKSLILTITNWKALLVYSYSPGVSLFGNYTLQIGEAVSTATPNPTILAASESVAPMMNLRRVSVQDV